MEYEVLTDLQGIEELLEDRNRKIFSLPESFRDDSFRIDPEYSYTIASEFALIGKATFENKENRILVSSAKEARSRFSYGEFSYPLDPSLCKKGNHNIQLGEVKIIEHPLAWMLAYGIYADFHLSESSFPTFDDCDRPYLEGMKGNLKKGEKRRRITVSNPFALVWEKGYCILEPPEQEETGLLFLDHQVSYPGTTVGNARIRVPFGAETFSYFADARTTAFRTKKDAENFYQIGLAGGLKDYPFTLENVLLLDEDRIYNPRGKYFDPVTEFDFEFLCHELIDIASWIRFIEEEYSGKFSGRMTTYLFDHHKQIDIAQFTCDREELKKRNLEIVAV